MKLKRGDDMPQGWYPGQILGIREGRGRQGGRGAGPQGNCICPSCGYRIAHAVGEPCYEIKCPECGTLMTRE